MCALLPVRYRSSSGEPRISVTQVLTLQNRIDATWFTPEAAARGSLVHSLTEQFDTGVLDLYPDDVAPYLDAYATFMAVVRPTYEATEVEVQSERLKVAGRIDRLGVIFGVRSIIDFKTGPHYPWHGVQLAGYNLIRGELLPRWTVHLQSDGRYRLRQLDDVEDYRTFLYDAAQVVGRVYPEGDFWVPAA